MCGANFEPDHTLPPVDALQHQRPILAGASRTGKESCAPLERSALMSSSGESRRAANPPTLTNVSKKDPLATCWAFRVAVALEPTAVHPDVIASALETLRIGAPKRRRSRRGNTALVATHTSAPHQPDASQRSASLMNSGERWAHI
jgi:hypothetical protein